MSEEGDDGSEGGENGYGRLLESGETRTDVDGRVSVAFTPQRVAYDRRLSLEVEVVDGAQRVGVLAWRRGRRRGLSIELRPLRLRGQRRRAASGGRDHEGTTGQSARRSRRARPGRVEPARAALRLEPSRWPRSRRTTSVSRGRPRHCRPAVARRLAQARAFADDARGNRIGAETGVWVTTTKSGSYGYRYPSLEAIADRDTFAPGDTASILVNTDVKDASVLVSVEGRTLRDVRVQHLFGGSGLVRVR